MGAHRSHSRDCRHARAEQVPPPGEWFVWLLLTGRGFGKSRAAAEWLLEQAKTAEPAEWAVIARNSADVNKNARDLTAGLVVLAERDGLLRQYNRHENDIYLSTGAIIHLISADKPDRLRGFNLAGAWCDELATWRYAADTWDQGLMPTLRSGSFPRVVVTTTPKPVPLLKRLVDEARREDEDGKPVLKRSRVITSGSTWSNQQNLAANFISEMRSAYGGTRIGRQELEGELLFDLSGALVSAEMIESARRGDSHTASEDDALRQIREHEPEFEGFQRIVVAVDPAGSYGEESDETGIVVCAKGRNGQGYVLADRSCKASPKEWATVAAAAYAQYNADALAAEKNMGHDMVEDVIRSVIPHVRYIPIQAVRGKRLRAEPITALYEQGRIHHVGIFAKLEDQLCEFNLESKKSPDRMDALVHGFTELGLAQFNSTYAFMAMMKKQIQDRQENPSSRDTRNLSRFQRQLDRRAGRPLRERERQQRSCQHRWRVTSDGQTVCAYACGAVREAS